MPSVINTNISSLTAQRNLGMSQASLATSMQRLSSGLRINSAKDDAAGLAISDKMTSQIKGMNQAVRNANDGISLAQTAEGALGEIGNNLQRIRELSVQSSNATNSDTDRTALQKEVSQLQSEIQRVASLSDFNGNKLLDGTFSGKAFQVGANAGQLIAVDSIASAQTSAMGSTQFAAAKVGGTVTDAATSGLMINGTLISNVTAQGSVAATGTAIAAAINAKVSDTGVVATFSTTGTNANKLVLTSTTAGKELTVSSSTAGDAIGTITGATSTLAASTVSGVDISTFAGAQQSIAMMDTALTEVNSSRAGLGAIQNRFTAVVNVLQTSSENLSASRSRIQDADFAAETASLSRSQILQQAGTAMVAQANQLPQGVLALLR